MLNSRWISSFERRKLLFAVAHGTWLSCLSESYLLVVSGKVELTRCGGELTRWRLSRPWANLLLIFSLQSSDFGGPTLELISLGVRTKRHIRNCILNVRSQKKVIYSTSLCWFRLPSLGTLLPHSLHFDYILIPCIWWRALLGIFINSTLRIQI